MYSEYLNRRLNAHLNIELELILNENRSTMLSVLEKRRGFARLSIHKLFLNAPDPVIEAIAHYVKGTRKDKRHHQLILRAFIQEQLTKIDLTHLVDQRSLLQEGNVYHLQEIYSQLNAHYFENTLELSITWFGNKKKKRRSHVTFGCYLDGLRLIKIHRMLDDPFFPEYYVSFVVYHEMLHAVVPGSVTARGCFSFHTPAFKEREKEFEHYHKATKWETLHKKDIFSYGWA